MDVDEGLVVAIFVFVFVAMFDDAAVLLGGTVTGNAVRIC